MIGFCLVTILTANGTGIAFRGECYPTAQDCYDSAAPYEVIEGRTRLCKGSDGTAIDVDLWRGD